MTRPVLSQREAAAACGVHLSTIRRYREAGRFGGARRDPVRGWLIPVEDLLAAGLRVHAPTPPDGSGEGEQPSPAQVAELERELLEMRHARDLARAEARHLREQVTRQDESLRLLWQAMRALTTGSADAREEEADGPGQAPAPPPSERSEAGGAGGWFRRLPRRR